MKTAFKRFALLCLILCMAGCSGYGFIRKERNSGYSFGKQTDDYYYKKQQREENKKYWLALNEEFEAEEAQRRDIEVLATIQAQKGCPGCTLTGLFFAEADFSGYDFSGADFSDSDLRALTLRKANFNNAKLVNTRLLKNREEDVLARYQDISFEGIVAGAATNDTLQEIKLIKAYSERKAEEAKEEAKIAALEAQQVPLNFCRTLPNGLKQWFKEHENGELFHYSYSEASPHRIEVCLQDNGSLMISLFYELEKMESLRPFIDGGPYGNGYFLQLHLGGPLRYLFEKIHGPLWKTGDQTVITAANYRIVLQNKKKEKLVIGYENDGRGRIARSQSPVLLRGSKIQQIPGEGRGNDEYQVRKIGFKGATNGHEAILSFFGIKT